MRKVDIIVRLAILAGCGYLFYVTTQFPPALQPSAPGPAFFPQLILAAICFFTLCLLGFGLLARSAPTDIDWNLRLIGPGAAWVIGFLVVLNWIGFVAASFLMMVALSVNRIEGWPKIFLSSAIMVAITYLLFDTILGVDLIQGPWGF
jgi:hypothetical protein